jgi:hypothetical protein
MASGNYCKTFMAIQRWDQKLRPFSNVIPVWSDKTSYSASRDSMGNTMKTASGNYCKTFMAIQRIASKVMALFNYYSGLERQDLLFIE